MSDYPYENLGIDLLMDTEGDAICGPNGDLADTGDGRRTLLQDIVAAFNRIPGELNMHPRSGGGVDRLIGQTYSAGSDPMRRALEDTCINDESVCGRINADSVEIEKTVVDGETKYAVSLLPIGAGETGRLNFVYSPNWRPTNDQT